MNSKAYERMHERMGMALVSANSSHVDNSARIEKIASTVGNTSMEKIAGMMIDNPTLENCEDFVRRYMLQEMALLPKLQEFSVNIIPSAYSKENESFLADATGMVRIKIGTKTLEIPFLLYNSELVPFDIIQLDGQRVPYSRENLVKIVNSLTHQENLRQQGVVQGDSPYEGLAEHYNTSTVPGFMGEALAIRDTHAHRTGTGSMYVTAGDYDYGFEKQAFTKGSRPDGDFLGLGLYSEKRRPETKEDKEARKDQKEKDDEADGKEKKASYKVDGSNNIIGSHDLTEVGKSPSGNVLYKNKKGEYFDFFHEGDEIKPVNESRAKELYPNLFKKASIITDLDAILDKVASVRAMSDAEFQAIADVINKKTHEDYKERINKIASQMPDMEMTRMEKRAMEDRLSKKFKTLSSFKNGDFILFPEMSNGAISLTPAIVLETSKGKMILANDRRYEIVKDQSQFICMASDTEFKIKMGAVNQLKPTDTFVLLVGDKAEPVQSVIDVKNYMESTDMWDNGTEKQLPKVLATFIRFGDKDGQRNNHKRFCILDQIGVPMTVSTEDCLKLIAKEKMIAEKDVRAHVSEFGEWDKSEILAVPPKTPIILVENQISGRITNNKQYEELMKLASTGHEVKVGMEKVAFGLNTITVKCLNPRTKVFDLAVEYKDSSARMMAKRRQDFKAISIGKLKAILYMLQYDGQTINDIIYKAKNEPQAQYPLPANCTEDHISQVFGGEVTNASKEGIKQTIGQFINPYILAKSTAAAAGVGMLSAAAVNQIVKGGPASEALLKGVNFMGDLAKKADTCAVAFEKQAIAEESFIHQDYAKAMTIASIYAEKLASAMKDDNSVHATIKDAGVSILASKPVLEKFAYEITKEKMNGLRTQNKANTEVLSMAVGVLDTMYKVALEVEKNTDLTDMKFM